MTFILLAGALLGSEPLNAQEHRYSVWAFGSLTTSSKVFYNSDDPDQFLRGRFFSIDNVISGGIDIRRNLEPLGLQIGLGIEYLSTSERFDVPDGAQTIPVSDGFTALPVELSGYFTIPIGSEKLLFYMGGGGGVYIGSRQYTYAEVRAETIRRSLGVGIHIVSGAEYRFSGSVAIRSEIKFRDVQFETTNRFPKSTAVIGNRVVILPQESLSSRINIDGMNLALGIAFHF